MLPHGTIPAWQIALSALLLLGISLIVISLGKRVPAAAVGWLWYLGMLAPVSGIVQSGLASHADRYTYLPLIGVFLAIASCASGAGPTLAETAHANDGYAC